VYLVVVMLILIEAKQLSATSCGTKMKMSEHFRIKQVGKRWFCFWFKKRCFLGIPNVKFVQITWYLGAAGLGPNFDQLEAESLKLFIDKAICSILIWKRIKWNIASTNAKSFEKTTNRVIHIVWSGTKNSDDREILQQRFSRWLVVCLVLVPSWIGKHTPFYIWKVLTCTMSSMKYYATWENTSNFSWWETDNQ
jgi:hypothetical protein